ncbi:hypothetical protein K450DRAFT_297892 [Umbelopsis ramanniana AG]|uniref:Uncharacterized protein n=1 Tax=Umbelopsis ramanniana AG TaxID=1314678 RepID=A0AAD5EGF0_UMBRA|nr:uncharacterized protein K450DRAFT_297892 [Umbelopsis ramanniana AG]KAI8582545.1 hypothetical protein K450DRAFT_297892 [Umbelopsis ramanniana AG]
MKLLAVICSSAATEVFIRKPSFWLAKNIFISVMIPDISSHTTWVLEIGQELASRGHNVTFLCTTGSEKYLRDYPNINLLTMGESPLVINRTQAAELQEDSSEMFKFQKWFFRTLNSNLRSEFKQYSEYIAKYKPDVFLCDHFADSCMRAAEEHEIPFIATSTTARGPVRVKDADAPFLNDLMLGEPTTEYQSIWLRFLNRYILENVIQGMASSLLNENTPVRKDLGLKSAKYVFSRKMDDSVKLINNFFGLEPARPLGPLVRFIGPIMASSYPSLDDTTAAFLESHQKVAYVSFGHHASPVVMDITKVLIALFDSVESGVLDGFMWASVSLPTFPGHIVSSSGAIYNVTDMIQNGAKYEHYRFTTWAAQFAILAHPSTALFLTHGGANSIFESLYSGTKMLVHPFFTDQPQNARMLQLAGAALTYNRKTTKATEIADLLRRVVEDDDHMFQKNVSRLSAIVQLRAADAIRNGAAVVEEVLFSSDEDDLPHLYVASRNMNYLKANNIDITLLLVAIVGGIMASIFIIVKQLITYLIACSNAKTKLE